MNPEQHTPQNPPAAGQAPTAPGQARAAHPVANQQPLAAGAARPQAPGQSPPATLPPVQQPYGYAQQQPYGYAQQPRAPYPQAPRQMAVLADRPLHPQPAARGGSTLGLVLGSGGMLLYAILAIAEALIKFFFF